MCGSCRSCSTALGPAQTQDFSFCHAFGLRILMPVLHCTRYDDKRLPSLQDMYDQAFYLTTTDDKKPIGFVTAKEWYRRNSGSVPVSQPSQWP
jgi:hypothetical protein